MPEGDSLHRAAARLQPLVGETLAVEAHHPRAQVLRIAEEIDGKRLEGVKAVGKNLLLTFEGGLVLRGREHQGVLWNGAVLQLARRHPQVERLGPDVMLDPPDLDGMVARLRATDKEREVGDALLDQRLVAGIGNMWKAEGLFLAGQSPWSRLHEVSDEELRRVLDETSRAMRATRRQRHLVYGRVGLPCRRCNALIDAWRQGDDARTAFWCPSCQAGPREPRRPRIRSNKLCTDI